MLIFQLNFNVFSKRIKKPLDREHIVDRQKLSHRKVSLVLANFNGFAKTIKKPLDREHIFERQDLSPRR